MLVVFDTETTDLIPRGVVELACHVNMDSGVTFQMTERMNPGIEIDPKASDVHGIYDHHVMDKLPAKQVIQEWWEEITGLAQNEQMTLAGHNCPFDLRAIRKYVEVPHDIPVLDTLRLSRQLFPEFTSHKLGHVFTQLGFSLKEFNLHEALADVMICKQIIDVICQRQNKSYLQLAKEQAKPMPLKVMPFGKHKGTKWSEIPYSYLTYMLDLPDLQLDVKAAMQKEVDARR